LRLKNNWNWQPFFAQNKPITPFLTKILIKAPSVS